jgi:hypothetical protein
VKNNPINNTDPMGLKENDCDKECNQTWDRCYTNCMNTLVPFDAFRAFVYSNMIANAGFYLSGGVTTITIEGKVIVIAESPTVLSGASRIAAGTIGKAGLWAAGGVAAWVAGISYGCMIACILNKCSYR